MIYFLSFLCIVFFIALIAAAYYLLKFARIIMILEDDFSEAIDDLSAVEASIESLLTMQLFFDSKEVKLAVQESLGEVRKAKVSVGGLIQKFVARSKNKYVIVYEDEDEDDYKIQKMLKNNKLIRNGNLLNNDF